ncbi:MAG: GNAT family N-acetyltransferase [Acidobacteria bacterium]|nr:GNAT family N-acetyltransferase [Acidobacteriota bacterium]
MNALETERLRLRPLDADDAPFILELLNEPSWIRFIGDRGVRTLDDARRYIAEGPAAMYALHGLGLLLVETKEGCESLGICGLIRRAALPDVDIGFAFLPRHWGKGFAFEAAEATIAHARHDLGLPRLLAITSLDNDSSIRLLEKLGMEYVRTLRLPGEDEDLKLFAIELDEGRASRCDAS